MMHLEKMLKTGTVAPSLSRSVQSSSSFFSEKLVSAPQSCHQDYKIVATFMKIAQKELAEHCTTMKPCPSNPEVASTALIAGYLARDAVECIPRESCTAPLQGPKTDAPILGPVAHQDWGGLCYFSQEQVKVLLGLQKFADIVLHNWKQAAAKGTLMASPFSFATTRTESTERCCCCPLLKNSRSPFSPTMQPELHTDNVAKLLEQEPLSRKVLKF